MPLKRKLSKNVAIYIIFFVTGNEPFFAKLIRKNILWNFCKACKKKIVISIDVPSANFQGNL